LIFLGARFLIYYLIKTWYSYNRQLFLKQINFIETNELEVTNNYLRDTAFLLKNIGPKCRNKYNLENISKDTSQKKNSDVLQESFTIKFWKYLKIIVMVFTDRSVLYYIVYLSMATLGSFVHPLFFSLLLVEIINKYSTLRNFLRAITLPWK
jgi:hypothetical protein